MGDFMSYQHWTKEEEAYLIKLTKQGYSIKKCAERLKRSPSSINSRRRILRQAGTLEVNYKVDRSWTHNQVALLKLVWGDPTLSTHDIVGIIGKSQEAIYQKASILELKRGLKGDSEPESEDLKNIKMALKVLKDTSQIVKEPEFKRTRRSKPGSDKTFEYTPRTERKNPWESILGA